MKTGMAGADQDTQGHDYMYVITNNLNNYKHMKMVVDGFGKSGSPYLKPIPVQVDREFLSERLQFFQVQGCGLDGRLVGKVVERPAFEVINGRFSIIFDPFAVSTDPVHTDGVALVFQRSGPEQSVPNGRARFWPVGDIYQQIIFKSIFGLVIAVPAPQWKPKIVADQWHDFPFPEVAGHTLFALGKSLVLIAHAEEMAFVIKTKTAVWRYPIQTVVIVDGFFDDIAPHDGSILLPGHLVHPSKGFVIHGFCQAFCFHGKPGVEHLRQDDDICVLFDLPYLFFQHGEVGVNVLPVNIRLDQCGFKQVHKLSFFRKTHAIICLDNSFADVGQFAFQESFFESRKMIGK